MKTWLVDTNVLLDVIGADETFGPSSKQALTQIAESGILVINPIIYAEVAVWIGSIERLVELLPDNLFRRDDIPWDAAFLASQAFGRYRRAGGKKNRMLADFLIGGHAAASGFHLISRDRGYEKYFNIEVREPSAMV